MHNLPAPWQTKLRLGGLATILIRAGLKIDKQAFKRAGLVVLRLATLPMLAEVSLGARHQHFICTASAFMTHSADEKLKLLATHSSWVDLVSTQHRPTHTCSVLFPTAGRLHCRILLPTGSMCSIHRHFWPEQKKLLQGWCEARQLY